MINFHLKTMVKKETNPPKMVVCWTSRDLFFLKQWCLEFEVANPGDKKIKKGEFQSEFQQFSVAAHPIASMYDIFTYIWLIFMGFM